ncbi:Phytochrome-like protein cph1 [Symmachiella macrocystis]|uniref:histidine kinase n=1 Tax=Symmachiella macrocystis TaxID=2527985 RepID=A0A5C6BKH9_9PLAN|nr:PAS domain S-box protein [Symmachiella macrocystis]TWU11699.1 Phytochrome-like protein cph1 [Symmachiella macrocystis]
MKSSRPVGKPATAPSASSDPLSAQATATADDAIRSLEERLEFEILISDMSAAIVNSAADDVDGTISDILRQVAAPLGIDRLSLFTLSANEDRLCATHVYCRSGCENDIPPRELEFTPELLSQLLLDNIIELNGSPADDESAPPFQRLLVPVQVNGVPRGALECHRSGAPEQWQPYVIRRLQLLGNIIANTLSRTQTAEELAAAKTRFSLAVAGSTDGIWDLNFGTGELFYSDRFIELMGFKDVEVDPDTNTFDNHIHPDDAKQNNEAIKRHLKNRVPYDVEYRLRTHSGKYRWFHARGQAIWNDEGCALRMAGSIQDIDARKQAEAALVNAAKRFVSLTGEELFQSLVTHLAESLDADFAFIGSLNRESPEGMRTNAVYTDGKIIDNFDYDVKGTPCEQVISQQTCVFSSGVQQQFPKDEMLSTMDVEAYVGTTIFDSRGQPQGLVSLLFRRPLAETLTAQSTLKIIAGHISAELERNQAKVALRSSEQRIRQFFDLGVIGMAISTPDKCWVDVNDRLYEILGYTPEELEQLSWVDLSHPDDVDIDIAQFERVLAGEIDGYSREKRYIVKNGEVIHVSVAVNCTRSADGTVDYFSALVQDITDRKRTEQALYASEQHLRAIIDMTPACVKLHTREGILLEMNAAGLALIEAESTDDIRGMCVYDLITEEYRDAYRKFVDRVWHGEKGTFEFEIVALHGTRRHMESKAVLLETNAPNPLILSITNDITARKEAEIDREALIQELESKNTELERFTYTVSHDLKSPLVTIKGFLGLLQKDLTAGNISAVEDDCSEISDAADKMAQLLDGLLELSRVGRIANPSENVDFGEIVAQALRTSAGGIAQKGVHMTVAPEFPTVFGDRLRLLEVIQNLIDNAIQYCSPSDPCIEIGVRNDAKGTVCFVRNNGTGIDPKFHDRVFKIFEQLDANDAGSGIGLAIVKRIIDVHGGDIWVESKGEQSGCSFVFSLP